MKKQTAVEFIAQELSKQIDNNLFMEVTFNKLLEQAKQMENEQRFEDFKQGFHSAFESLEAANNSVQSKTFKSE